jgi:hypothetical protein
VDESRQALPATEEHGPTFSDPSAPGQEHFGMTPAVVAAYEAFRRELPQLLQTHPGKWVAYSGARRLGLGDTKTDLYQMCLSRGLPRREFIVDRIVPRGEVEVT